MNNRDDERDLVDLQRRSTDISQLLKNVYGYLEQYTLSNYIENFGGRIVSGTFAQSGVYNGKPHVYVRVVKTFIFFADVLCDTPEYAERRGVLCLDSLTP